MSVDTTGARKNIFLYKRYKIFSYDFLFYYAVEVLYFTIVKKMSLSDLMYINAFYTLFAFFWQLTGSMIVEKLGMKKSIVFGNILVFSSVIGYILSNSFLLFNIINFVLALGFSLKSLAEGSLIYSSLKSLGRRKDFPKIEGKSNAKYFYLDAISSVLSGFLFVVNGYLPMVLCFVCAFISFLISLKFYDLESSTDYDLENDEKVSFKSAIGEFKNLVKNNRAKSMLLFSFVFWGIISVFNTLYKAIILDIGIMEQYSTIVVAIVTLFIGFGARWFYGIEKKTKNNTLTYFSYTLVLTTIIIGIVGLFNILNIYTLSIILICLSLFGLVQGAYRVAMKKYVLNFTNRKVRVKITSAYYIVENLGKSLILFGSGYILDLTTNSRACIIFSILTFIILQLIITFMKDKFGLKPEEYSSDEIYNTKLVNNKSSK